MTFAVQRIVAPCIVAVSSVGGNSPMMLGPAEGCAQNMDMVSMSNLFLDGYRNTATAPQREGLPGRPGRTAREEFDKAMNKYWVGLRLEMVRSA